MNPSSLRQWSSSPDLREPAPVARRVFVTGGTGYIGRRLIPALRTRGHCVTALENPPSGVCVVEVPAIRAALMS